MPGSYPQLFLQALFCYHGQVHDHQRGNLTSWTAIKTILSPTPIIFFPHQLLQHYIRSYTFVQTHSFNYIHTRLSTHFYNNPFNLQLSQAVFYQQPQNAILSRRPLRRHGNSCLIAKSFNPNTRGIYQLPCRFHPRSLQWTITNFPSSRER